MTQVTARTTRLVRAPDLAAFRHEAVALACEGTAADVGDRLVVVPTRAAAAYLTRAIERRLLGEDQALLLPAFVTRAELHRRLAERLPGELRQLGNPEREVLMAVACRRAIRDGAVPPFQLRPGLVGEIVDFFDTLHRNLKPVDAFERLALGALEPGAGDDRGAERLIHQTRFLAAAFRHFERLCEETGAPDEHRLRAMLIREPSPRPWRHVVLAVGDRAGDEYGLFAADWDLLARLPGLERIDVLATDATIAGAFHERIHHVLPGIEETRADSAAPSPSPRLLVPPGGASVHPARDREDEVAGFARWVRHERLPLEDTALVVRRPLPYAYITREVLRSAGVPLQMWDTLPLAAEPFAAAIDLVFACVVRNCARGPAVELLRSPHFNSGLPPRSIARLERALSEAGYAGGLDALEVLLRTWEQVAPERSDVLLEGARVLRTVAAELAPLREPAPCHLHLDRVLAFIQARECLPAAGDPLRPRLLRGRAAILSVLTGLRDAHARFDEEAVDFETVAALVKRSIEARTFAPRTGEGGVHLIDAGSARFGDFAHVQLAGLVDGEWPENPRRNIFYPPFLLRDLGWPPESERLDAARAAFTDLLRLPSEQLVMSTFSLEGDAPVSVSTLVDLAAASGLDSRECTIPQDRIFEQEAVALDPVDMRPLGAAARAAVCRRIEAAARPGRRAGATSGHRASAYSVSSLERYQDCPFKFFAANVLRIPEPSDDRARAPRLRGQFLHQLFQRFFEVWEARGGGTVTVGRIDEARALFEEVAAPVLAELPEAETALERAALFGSAVSPGTVDLVLGLEASGPEAVLERRLEYPLKGEFSLGSDDGRRVALRGVADRIDLLAGRRLRVIDYKSGVAPNPKRALQVPIYALCALEDLGEGDGNWTVHEAMYVAFSGRRSLVPVVDAGADPDPPLAAARDRLHAVLDGVERGEFPPRPHDIRICSYCAYPSVCRKDYVGDE
ncbi:MAG: hypothetical protein A3F70_00300 [Acidobacteria bacterium RIFCSPLOWO2_12_FULL_67_14]|nr:MAG: hypothetical protein A3H29_17365 [Acidobacteria bacterium RIFCSPLOWO2_02_FULL_67_21]OFW41377.1 MAG: hypothetical protein A3F70_00300 [Acidobacteria bacterium RIFCSPLOWO2_12_FULL_67_14]